MLGSERSKSEIAPKVHKITEVVGNNKATTSVHRAPAFESPAHWTMSASLKRSQSSMTRDMDQKEDPAGAWLDLVVAVQENHKAGIEAMLKLAKTSKWTWSDWMMEDEQVEADQLPAVADADDAQGDTEEWDVL